MKYLVTGGAGFIGSHIVDEIVRRGHDAVVLDDLSTGSAANLEQARGKIEFLQQSIMDLESVRHACQGAAFVIHLAARTSVPQSVADPIETNRVNVDGTLNVLVAAKDAGVKRVVFASSCAVYGELTTLPLAEVMPLGPISPYGVTKMVGEAYGQTFHKVYGLEFVPLRFFNIFGPRQDPGSAYSGVLSLFNAALLHGKQPKIYGDGEQSRDFTYVQNVVEANLLACEAPLAVGHPINVGTGRRQTLNETLAALKSITGKPTDPEYFAARNGDIRHSQADITRAQKLLNYQPQVGFEEGLARTWKWFSNAPKN